MNAGRGRNATAPVAGTATKLLSVLWRCSRLELLPLPPISAAIGQGSSVSGSSNRIEADHGSLHATRHKSGTAAPARFVTRLENPVTVARATLVLLQLFPAVSLAGTTVAGRGLARLLWGLWWLQCWRPWRTPPWLAPLSRRRFCHEGALTRLSMQCCPRFSFVGHKFKFLLWPPMLYNGLIVLPPCVYGDNTLCSCCCCLELGSLRLLRRYRCLLRCCCLQRCLSGQTSVCSKHRRSLRRCHSQDCFLAVQCCSHLVWVLDDGHDRWPDPPGGWTAALIVWHTRGRWLHHVPVAPFLWSP